MRITSALRSSYWLGGHRKDENGASSVEYGLLVFAIAAAVALIVFLLGDAVVALFTNTCGLLEGEAATGVAC